MDNSRSVRGGRGVRRGRGVQRGRGRGSLVPDSNISTVATTSTTTDPIHVRGSRGRGRRGRGSRGRGSVRGSATVASMVNDYIQATSTNLPKLNFIQVAEYFQNLRSPELRQAKDSVSAHADYGDNAIGYVRLLKIDSECTVEARFTPQTSVNNTPYFVSVVLNEISHKIIRAECNCQASMGGCKHQTALIFWLLRRSEEPSPTDVACYWKKSILSTVKQLKAKTVDELCGRPTDFDSCDDSLLKAFIERGKDTNPTAFVIRYSECRKTKQLYMDHLMIWFLETYTESTLTCDKFLEYCSEKMTALSCQKVYDETMDQNTKAQWYYQRFARITASKLYETSKCNTADGSLVAALMGARSFKGNSATKRIRSTILLDTNNTLKIHCHSNLPYYVQFLLTLHEE